MTLLLIAFAVAGGLGLTPMPGGDTGIASKYPGDAGIAADPAVIFHDGFEDSSNAADLRKKWDAAVHHASFIRLAREPVNVHRGKKSLEFTVPQQGAELSNSVAKQFADGRDLVFLRYYSKFERGFDQVGSSHNGGVISARYVVNGKATPGIPADGKNKFLVSFENVRFEPATRSPGPLGIYC
jgi:hypothetical protein